MSFLKVFFSVLLSLALLLAAGILGLAGMAAGQKPRVPSHATLVLRLDGGLADYPTGGGAPWESHDLTLHEARQALRMAAVDKRIERVVLDVSAVGRRFANHDELRARIHALRAAGKPVYAFVQNLNPTTLYVAAAADSIWMPLEGGVEFTGFAGEQPFARGMLDKLGIHVKQHQIEAYKAAGELTTRTDMSGPARDNDQWLLDATVARWRAVLRQDRGLTDATIDSALARALFFPEDAIGLHLVDGLAYWDDVVRRFDDPKAAKDPKKTRFIDATRYAEVDPASVGLKGGRKIAIVHAQGIIAGRESGRNPLLGTVMGWGTVCDDLRRAGEDKNIAAVVFRVDSQGGSSYASDMIAHAVAELQRRKPVVVSMGAIAASGGYKISYPCSLVVADEMTMTGSIGSLITWFNLKGMWDRLGITWDGVSYGPRADLLGSLRDWTPEERDLVVRNHWASYDLWVRDIARVRGLDFAHLDTALARGRVWTGRQAMERGLVDSLGTLDDAIRMAAARAGVAPGTKVSEVHWPERTSFVDALLSGRLGLARQVAAERTAAWLWHSAAAPVTGTAGTLHELATDRALELEPLGVGLD
jgi:protease-4